MANITAADVNKLRKQTGAGMMDCKNALVETNGDFEKAIDALRKKGQKVANKRGDRSTNEGLVMAKATSDNKKGILLCLACETDFVAQNKDFKSFFDIILTKAIDENPDSIDALNALNFTGTDLTIQEKITEQIGVIGEKIEISEYKTVETEYVTAYNHPGNRLASVIGFNNAKSGIDEIGKQVAMQVAAMGPIAIDENEVASDVIEREMSVGREQALTEGKPEAMIDKIATGKVKKFLKENTLLNQASIMDNKKTVAQVLKDFDSELSVTKMERLMLG